MENFDKIQGKNRFEVFKQLQKNKTLIKMHLMGKDYDRLTIIIDLRIKKKESFFCIDYPKGFKEAVTNVDPWKIHFEFTFKDNIPHSFRTTGGEISEGNIWIKFPEVIERKQRRKHFRIEPPRDTKIHFNVNSIKMEMKVINISLGGLFGYFTGPEKAIQLKPILKIGQTLNNLELAFTFQEKNSKVNINQALVKRVEKKDPTNIYHYAIQFTDIENKEKKTLKELIYGFQRHFLKNRLPNY